MKEYQLKTDEVILFEKSVNFKTNQNVKFTLTSKNMIFEKEKGIFKKKMCVIENIPIDKIKIYKDKVQIKQKKSTIFIQTTEKNIKFTFDNVFDAKQVVEEIINIRTDSNFLDRTTEKVNYATKIIKSFVGLATAVAAIPIAVKELDERKEEIVNFFKSFKK